MSLQDNIKLVISTSKLKKPNIITNVVQKDTLVENDLQNKDLFDIKSKDIIKLLSSDLQTFNDYAFRYYILQFIYFYFIDEDYIMEDMFIQVFFESTLLNKRSERYLQFTNIEIEIIIRFLEYIISQIQKSIGDIEAYNKLEPWEQEDIIAPFKHYEADIKNALIFWKSNPKYSPVPPSQHTF